MVESPRVTYTWKLMMENFSRSSSFDLVISNHRIPKKDMAVGS
jgi:hypothetical protein